MPSSTRCIRRAGWTGGPTKTTPAAGVHRGDIAAKEIAQRFAAGDPQMIEHDRAERNVQSV
jgi:hypothetical protein